MTTIFITMFVMYMISMGILGYIGFKKTTSMRSFAVSKGDVNPYFVGITWAATFMSAGTFLGLPGLAYKNGLSLLWYHMGHWFPAIIMLALVAGGYRRIADRTDSLTLPDWLADVYNSKALRLLIAIVCLCNVVLIATQFVGVGVLMNVTLGIPYKTGIVIGLIVVISYLFLGGTYAHIYTNVIQGAMMVILAGAIILTGFYLWGDIFTEVPPMLAAIDPTFVQPLQPNDVAFATPIAISGIFIANACWSLNPQLMNKVQYLKGNREIKKFILVAGLCLFLGGAVSLGGLYSRVLFPTGLSSVDDALPQFVTNTYSPFIAAFFNVVLLAATMSTVDGIMVMMATILGNTFYRQVYIQNKIDRGISVDHEKVEKTSFWIAKWSIVLVGVAALPIAFDRPASLNILNWVGTGVILSAVSGPLLVAVTYKKLHQLSAISASVISIAVYLVTYIGKIIPSVYLAVGVGCLVSIIVAFLMNMYLTSLRPEGEIVYQS